MTTVLKENHGTGFTWIDLAQPEKKDLQEIAAKYGLHRTLVEDSLQPAHLPKYEQTDSVQFVILRAYADDIGKEADTIQEVTNKIAVFIKPEVIITIHLVNYDFIARIKDSYVDTGQCGSPYEILQHIIEYVLATYETPLATIIQEIDDFEPRIFLQEHNKGMLQTFYYLKRRAAAIDRVLDLSRVVLDNLHKQLLTPELNDLKDSHVRLQTMSQHIQDSLSSLLNIYISLNSQRAGEVMRILTLFSAFFMPLTFIVGIYGMNFQHMPELRWHLGYPAVLLAMIVVTGVIYIWFKRKGWL
jgi:magnesium transporter